MKKLKIKLFQKIADFIIERMRVGDNKRELYLLYNVGMNFNEYCISKDIFLD